MKVSVRNQIKEKIISVEKRQTPGHVRNDFGNRVIATLSITNEAIDDPALQVDADAVAVVHAAAVAVAK